MIIMMMRIRREKEGGREGDRGNEEGRRGEVKKEEEKNTASW